jgi:hypothetical protein
MSQVLKNLMVALTQMKMVLLMAKTNVLIYQVTQKMKVALGQIQMEILFQIILIHVLINQVL